MDDGLRIAIKLTRYMNGKHVLDSIAARPAQTPSDAHGAPPSTSVRAATC
ncbi:hypothetical protein [uncultured Arthrobacter sp.]|nr:hypothetical protein [uncultured Arthrobacter sp.]